MKGLVGGSKALSQEAKALIIGKVAARRNSSTASSPVKTNKSSASVAGTEADTGEKAAGEEEADSFLHLLYTDLDYDGNGFLTIDDWLFLKRWVT